MKKLLLLGSTLLLSTATFAAGAKTWNGWISDSHCGAKGSSAAHAACAKKCVEGGAKPVIVTDDDKKVMPIANPEAVKGHEGDHVKVNGTMEKDGAVHVTSVEAL